MLISPVQFSELPPIAWREKMNRGFCYSVTLIYKNKCCGAALRLIGSDSEPPEKPDPEPVFLIIFIFSILIDWEN